MKLEPPIFFTTTRKKSHISTEIHVLPQYIMIFRTIDQTINGIGMV